MKSNSHAQILQRIQAALEASRQFLAASLQEPLKLNTKPGTIP
jgi:hypothetical protein